MAAKVDLTINTKANTADLIKATEQAQEFINTLKLGVGIDLGGKVVEGIGEIGASFKDSIVEGVKFNSTVQDAQLAVAAMLKSFDPAKFKSFDAALAESNKGIDALRKAAVETPFSFETLLEALQGISAPLAEGGVKDLQKQVQLVTLLSQAAKTLNIPQQQFLPDARDLVSGRIGRTLLGRNLGITDDQVNQAKKQGDLYDFLSQKLSAYGEAGTRSLDNLSTRASNLYDKLQQVEGVSTEGIFNQVSDLAKDLGTAIATPEFESATKTVGAELEVITSAVASLIRVVADNPGIFLALSQGAFVFATSLALLNLPKVIIGLTQLATTAVPALANLAALGSAAKDDGDALSTTTAKVNANTDALKANAAAAASTAEAQSASGAGTADNADASASNESTQASTDSTLANTEATVENTQAVEGSTAATIASTNAAEVSNAATAESTALTEANTISTEGNTSAINASNAAALSNNQETLSSNDLTVASTVVTEENTASTVDNTGSIDESNAAAVANNAETLRSNELTAESTALTIEDTDAVEKNNAAAEQSLAIGSDETAIAAKENQLTQEGAALDDTATEAVLRSNAAASQAVAIGEQETTIVATENRLTDESTAKTTLNTAAVASSNATNTEALAIGESLIAQEEGETAAIASHAETVAVDTAAIAENLAAKRANASAPAQASAAPVASGTAGGLLSAGNVSAALTAVLSIGQVYVAYEAYVEQIDEANADLGKQLDNQLTTLQQQVSTVSTQADKAQLIATLKDQEERVESAINTARDHGLETSSQTVQILTQYQDHLQESLVKAEGISNAQLDVRASTQAASDALSKEADALSKVSEGFDKAKIKYDEFKASQQATGAPTLAGRLQGNAQQGQSHLDAINSQITNPADQFSSNDDVQKFLTTADSQRSQLLQAQADASAAATATVNGLKASQANLAKAQAAVDNQANTGSGTQDVLNAANAFAKLDAAKQQVLEAASAKDDAAVALKASTDQLTVFNGKFTLAAQNDEQQKADVKQRDDTLKSAADSELKLQETSNKAISAENERAYKAGEISLQQYIARRRALLDQQHQAEISQINATPGLLDTQRANQTQESDIQFESGNQAINDDSVEKSRQEQVQQTQDKARAAQQQADLARASGNIVLAEQLDEQATKYQKIAEIQGLVKISDQDRAKAIATVSAALDKEFEQQQAQKSAEVSLETQEKQAADALSKLQSAQQFINSSNALPDDKNDALRSNILEQNQVLQEQIGLLEQRRQLALADPTKSPNDRALTAAGIQQQEDQLTAQVTGNQIAADKLTFTGQFTSDLANFAQSFGSTAQQAAGVVTGTLGTAVNSISENLTKIIEGTESVKQGFLAMVQAVVGELIQMAIKLAITLALQEALDVAGIATAPAAGAAAATAAAGLAGATSLAFADGGLVPGAPSHSDNRVATIATGEYVARTAAVQHYGPGLFEALNQMAIPRHAIGSIDMPVRGRSTLGFATGGLVAPMPFMAPSGSASKPQGNTNVHVGLINSQAAQAAWLRKGEGRKIVLSLVDGRMKDVGNTS